MGCRTYGTFDNILTALCGTYTALTRRFDGTLTALRKQYSSKRKENREQTDRWDK